MQLQKAVQQVFVQLSETLDKLSNEEYIAACTSLNNATIGQHVRHTIELFQCLEIGYNTGVVNYEKRKRDEDIQTDKTLANELLHQLYRQLDKENKELVLEATYDDHSDIPLQITTNYYREIAYNLEHTIHHMALIRIGVNEVSKIALPEEFGVASSTVKYKRECAQ